MHIGQPLKIKLRNGYYYMLLLWLLSYRRDANRQWPVMRHRRRELYIIMNYLT